MPPERASPPVSLDQFWNWQITSDPSPASFRDISHSSSSASTSNWLWWNGIGQPYSFARMYTVSSLIIPLSSYINIFHHWGRECLNSRSSECKHNIAWYPDDNKVVRLIMQEHLRSRLEAAKEKFFLADGNWIWSFHAQQPLYVRL